MNPASRRGLRRRAGAIRAFQEAGVEVRELVTQRPGHARDVLLARTEVWDAVFVLGGDGAVMEVVGALAHGSVPVGVLRGGTGNLVAGVLGVPFRVRRAVRALLAGDRRPFDLGRLPDGKFFAFAAGVGVDVAMVERTSHRRKRILGMFSYAITATRAALRLEMVNLTIDVDGREVKTRAVLAMVANAGSILGGRFSIGPEVKPDDGALDLCLFTPSSRVQVLGLFAQLLRRDFSNASTMQFIRGRRFRIVADPPVSVQADGDVVGRTPIEIAIDPQAIDFLVPKCR